MEFIEDLPGHGRLTRHNNVLVLEEKRDPGEFARARAALESLDC
jgi:hypothetical protein